MVLYQLIVPDDLAHSRFSFKPVATLILPPKKDKTRAAKIIHPVNPLYSIAAGV